MENLDIRMCLDRLGTSWNFGGSVTDGTESCWEAIHWEDARDKPTWAQLAAASALDIGEIAQAKLAAINDGKNRTLDGGFYHEGVLFDSDSKARLAYLEFAHKLSTSPLYSTPWKASTGHWVTMDATLFSALQPAYEQHIQACFAWQAAREMEVAAAVALGSIEGVKAVAEII
jgi:hypothetical protein